jgi:DNA-binding NarL/FixJ family response regulator
VRHPLPRVVIVDDHPTFRLGLRAALLTQAWADIIIEASSAAEAMEVVRRDDVVVMDIYMPDEDGIDAARELLERYPQVRVIILTTSTTQVDFDRARAAGVQGYVGKSAEPQELIEAFRAVISGESFLDPPPIAPVTRPPRATLPKPFDKLTSHERRALALYVDNAPGKRVAHDLNISHQGVKNLFTRVYKKLGVDGKTGVSKLMRELGIDNLD